jgi:spectinomycin phosphotransferase/16S rRNA (guanine(1405)-N(7))-methyltransferase
VLTPPADLPVADLVRALAGSWGVAGALTYRTVGFGSHHWEVAGAGGRWFLTIDEVIGPAQLSSLRAALDTASRLTDAGLAFVVAPLRSRDGDVLVQVGGRYALALYPFVDGKSFDWGEWAGADHRAALIEMLRRLHGTPTAAPVDDLAIAERAEVEASLAGDVDRDLGPYSVEAARLLADRAETVRGALERYDAQVAAHGSRSDRWVVTHGEPHPGNTMRTPDGWVLVDWDTVRLAPPERDLWHVDAGDGSALRAYAAATGVQPRRELLELYRLRWALSDIALEVARFRRPHTGTEQDTACWEVLRSTLAGLR